MFQVVQGLADTGRLLTRHPQIRKVSLTGEVGTGKAVMADAAATLKQVTLELGGKSPLIVFEDAKLENAVSGALLGNFYSAGEVCSNGTRVFVHKSVRAAFLERLRARTAAHAGRRSAGSCHPGRGADLRGAHGEGARLSSRAAAPQGARLLDRRRTRDRRGRSAAGFFVAPTVFDGCRDDMDIVREEIFGPVMTVLEFEDEDEVIARANATEFGLAAGVFTNDLTRAHRVIAQLQAGTCWINHYNVTPIELPFGGVKMSGLGRENGRAAIEHYTQLKSVYVAMGDIEAPTEGRAGRMSEETFDYVIVGAGSAGCVLADRLSEDGRTACCVLEYGGSDRSLVDPDADRAVDPDEHASATTGATRPSPSRTSTAAACTPRAARCSAAPRRSTAWCTCAATRSTSSAGRRRAPPAGRTRTCCPTSSAPSAARAAAMSTAAMPASSTRATGLLTNPLHAAWLEAGRQAGYPLTEDMNGFQQEGFGRMDMTVGGGRRCSAANAYLRPAMRRTNLTVRTHALVDAHRVRGASRGRRALPAAATCAIRCARGAR